MRLRRVVTAFLQEPEGRRVLLGRRSEKVNTYPGRWAGISGSIEDGPLQQALTEIREETGLPDDQVTRLGTGQRVRATDWELGTRWIIHPFLFRCEKPDVLRRNWEHTRFEWREPDAIRGLSTVPKLWQAYASAREAARNDGLPPVEDIFGRIERDSRHGAEDLGLWTLDALLAGLRDLHDEADMESRSREMCAEALHLRPSMAPPLSAAAEAAHELTEAPTPEAGRDAVENLLNRREAAPLDSARHAADEISAGATVVTLSYSSTVLATLHEAADKMGRLIVGESRPANEGRRTAKLAASFGIPVTLATDAGAASLSRDADRVLLGADALLEDGSAVNKTGSLALAAAAEFYGCPRLFVTTESKILPAGHEPEFEEKSPDELGDPIEGVERSNVYFERIPGELTGLVTVESGTLTAGRLQQVASRRKELCDMLQG